MNNTHNLKFNNDKVYKILQIKTNQANKQISKKTQQKITQKNNKC